MNPLGKIFLHDWRRMALALLLAFGLWWYVDGLLAQDRSYSLRVVAVGERLTPDFGTLAVRVPSGWTLVEPQDGSSIPVWLHGSRAELENFAARQFAAYVEIPAPALGPGASDFLTPVAPAQLEWQRPDEAAQLLAAVGQRQVLRELRLERLIQRPLELDHALLDVRGEAARDHEVMPWDARFDVTQVVLSGPRRVVEEAFAERARAADDPDLPASLLVPVQLEPTIRNDVTVMLHLAEAWRARGLAMDPEWVRVTVPVRWRAGGTYEWIPPLQVLQSSPPRWQVPAYSAKWRASLKYDALPPNQTLGAWVEEHVLFLLPLDRVGGEGLQQREVRLEWMLVGLDPLDSANLHDALEIRPVDPQDGALVVTRSGM